MRESTGVRGSRAAEAEGVKMSTYGNTGYRETSTSWRSSLGGTLPLALLCAAVALLFAALPQNSSGHALVTVIVYWSAAVFALAAVGHIAWRVKGRERSFWTLLWAGLLARFCGHLSWQLVGGMRIPAMELAPQDVAYFVSYMLLFAALIYLVALNTRGMALLCPLDILGVMLPAGLLAWYFVLGPAVPHTEGTRNILESLSGVATDAGFLFLSLLALSGENRIPFARWLTGGFAAFLAGDLLWAGANPFEPYEPGRWPELFWALGVAMIGLAALRVILDDSHSPAGPSAEIDLWKAFAFWLGPLSPAIQYAFMLSWTTLHPPVPTYVTWAGVALMLYLALRISALRYVERGLRLEGEKKAKSEEQRRISEELHDNLKQNVYGAAFLLDSYKEAREKWGVEEAEEVLDGAIAASREASHRVSRAVEELCTRCEESDPDIVGLLRGMLEDISVYFGVCTHEDLRADPCLLNATERAAAYRIASEALWNAAKHSGARNVWLESREVGPIFLVRVRDNGRGMLAEDSHTGFGLSLMKARAEEAGGVLDVISNPHGGTTVQARFDRR